MGIIRTIFIIILVYYGLKFLMRLLAPYLVKKMAENMSQRFNQQFQNQYRQQEEFRKREGEVTVESKPQKDRNHQTDEGEYVDYEEVK